MRQQCPDSFFWKTVRKCAIIKYQKTMTEENAGTISVFPSFLTCMESIGHQPYNSKFGEFLIVRL